MVAALVADVMACTSIYFEYASIDNYTRHFVPLPISTFALCSVHRTSVIKLPTVDYCVILKNARCTERYICPIVSVCIEQCPTNRKHCSSCSKTDETMLACSVSDNRALLCSLRQKQRYAYLQCYKQSV